MSLLSYLSNRQIGGTRNTGLHATCPRIDFDDQLSRLVTYGKDVFPTYIQNYPIPPFVCKFRKDRESDLLALANEEGEIVLIDTERSKILKSFIAHENAIFDICWLPDKNHMLTVSGDHNARLFDMNTCQLISSYHGHTASIKSVDVCHTESDVFVTGSRDGNICVWDRRERCGVKNNKPSNCIAAAHSRIDKCSKKRSSYLTHNAMSSISAVAFQDNTHLVSSGVADGVIKVWDLRRTYIKSRNYSPRYQMEYCNDKSAGHGCAGLVFDSLHRKLYASTTSNKIYRFDCHTYSNDAVVYTGLKCNTYFVKLDLSCDDQYLLCGSSNHKAYIWNINKPGVPILALPGHKAEVTSVAWSPYSIMKLVTVGDDHKLMIWRVQNSDDANSDYEYKAVSENFEDAEESEATISRDWGARSVQTPQRRRNNSLPDLKTTPMMKSITNFYSPLTPSPSMKSITNFYSPLTPSPSMKSITNFYSPLTPSPSFQKTTVNVLTSPESQGLPNPKDSAVSPQLRSPCKAMSDNDLVSNADATATSKSSPEGKENDTLPVTGGELSTVTKMIGQVKRKLNPHNSVIVICKYHPEGCGRTKGHTRCGKRVILTPDRHNIKKYFTVSPPE